MDNNRRIKKYRLWCAARLTAFLAGAFCIMALPLAAVGAKLIQYYQIVVGDQSYGCYESVKEAAQEVKKARKEWSDSNGAWGLTSVTCSIVPLEHNRKSAAQENVQEQLCRAFEAHKVESVEQACIIKVNDFTVTVASEGAVLDTLEEIKNDYDVSGCYEIALETSEEKDCLVPVFSQKEGVTADLQEIGFDQEIEVVPGYVSAAEITEPVSAAAALTKEWETPTTYTVEAGDCLSVIAEKHGMKTAELMELNQLTDSEWIYIGDELIVTVPQPEVSVWYKQRAAYEEEYEEDVIYQDNSSWYVGTEKVLQEGTTGRRQVVADILCRNGQEVSREILEETILVQAQPEIIERGTSTPPTYIKPLLGGSFSSPFGSRWGRMHKGVDWSCSIGTAVRASCGGRIVSAGWVNGYGNCIMISHSDGKQTRYAHLSKILVSTGQTVKQGEKIALSGNTGNSTGPHLHFEILVNGTQVNPLNYLE